MSNKYLFATLSFLAFFLMSRVVSTRATKELDPEIRHRIFDEFSTRNNVKTFIAFGVCAAFLIAITYMPHFIVPLSLLFFALCMIYFCANLNITRRKLGSVDAPANYVRAITISWALFVAGFGVIALGIVYL